MVKKTQQYIPISKRTQHVLLRILAQMSEDEVLSVQGCGRKSLNELKDILAKESLSFRKDKEFAEEPYKLEELKVKYALICKPFLVRYRDDTFVVIEYSSGGVYKLPIKELGTSIRCEHGLKIVSRRVFLSELVVGKIIRFNTFWSKIPR